MVATLFFSMSGLDFGPPTSVMIIGPSEVVDGEQVRLECSANGFPEPQKVYVNYYGILNCSVTCFPSWF